MIDNMLFVALPTTGSSYDTIVFNGSASDTAEHMYLLFGTSAGGQQIGVIIYIRFSAQLMYVKSFGDRECTGSISGGTAKLKVANYTILQGIARWPVSSVTVEHS